MKTLNVIWITLFVIFSVSRIQTHALEYSRATGQLTVELLVVADYSEFNKGYHSVSNRNESQHIIEAKHEVKKYIGALIRSSNNVFKSLESHNIFITIKLVDILVMTTESESPWTETVKVAAGTSFNVDPTRVLPLFQTKSTGLKQTIPHDHAMILTRYGLQGGGRTFSGYSYHKAICKPNSVSIVKDNDSFYTAQLIAHEIAHSLGCEHDGSGNSCSSGDGYAMSDSVIPANEIKWTFSSCSVAYIQNSLRDLDTNNNNCLEQVNNAHPNSLATFDQWYGQAYTMDEQCKLHFGSGSYMCRNHYSGNYTDVCLKLWCHDPHDPVRNSCTFVDGGDGTPCGSDTWCMSSDCVSASNKLAVDATCPSGDDPNTFGWDCNHVFYNSYLCSGMSYQCCFTCRHLPRRYIDIDRQCAVKYGNGSHFCRGSPAYEGKRYRDTVCWDLQCTDPNNANQCLSTRADKYTPCGNMQWCSGTYCVNNFSDGPNVKDTCPYGNQKGVAVSGLTCDQVKLPENRWRCYDSFTYKLCCDACDSVHRNVQGCEYGDKLNTCESSKCSTYDADTRTKCCETCAAGPIVG